MKLAGPQDSGWAARSAQPILELRRDGHVRWANAAAKALGLDAGGSVASPGFPGDMADRIGACLDGSSDGARLLSDLDGRRIAWTLVPRDGGEGAVACGFDVTDWSEAVEPLRKKDELLRAVAFAARRIVEAPDGTVPFDDVLKRLGEATGVSRVYVFRDQRRDDGVLTTSQIAEWAQPGVEPQIDNPEMQELPYDEAGMGRWPLTMAAGETVAGRVEEFSQEERAVLEPQGILTVVCTPIMVDGSPWGFIGFDECSEVRDWSQAELDILRTAADTLASAIQRRRTLNALAESQEQLLHAQRMDAVGRLAGGIAHDFNNILSGILGYAELLLEDLESGHPARDGLEDICKLSLRAAGLTRQLLAFSRKQPVKMAPVDVAELLRNLEGLVERLIGETIEVSSDVAPDLPVIQADAGQLEQVVMNLVVNARDAMSGGGRILISAHEAAPTPDEARARGLDAARRYVYLCVSDNGSGMPPEVIEKAFEPFFTTRESGTGMGLSIIYGIARQSGGAAWIHSRPGEGTRVTVALPVENGESLPAAAEPDPVPEVVANACILLVEDDAGVRDLIRRILDGAGYRVVATETAGAALARLEEDPRCCDLLLSDIGLPDRSGIDLAAAATKMRPELPVLLMSGYPGQRAPGVPLADEAVDFLPKPFTRAQLLQCLRDRLP